MADLTDIQAAQTVKVIGSGATGVEGTPVAATLNGEIRNTDIADNGGTSGVISVGGTAVPVRVGGSNLTNRKRLCFTNIGSLALYWSYSSGVTGAGNGCPLFRNQFVSDSWGPNTTIYIVCPTGTGSLWVGEGA